MRMLLLEPAAAAKAAEAISEGRLAELAAVLEQMRQSADDDSIFIQQDARFREMVAESAGNQTLASVLSAVSWRTMRARIWHGAQEAGASAETISQHAAIFEALRAHDPGMAHAAAVLHIGRTQAWFRRLIEDGDRRFRPVPPVDGNTSAV